MHFPQAYQHYIELHFQRSHFLGVKQAELSVLYSTLSNKCTGTNYRILRQNLEQGSVIIFDQ